MDRKTSTIYYDLSKAIESTKSSVYSNKSKTIVLDSLGSSNNEPKITDFRNRAQRRLEERIWKRKMKK